METEKPDVVLSASKMSLYEECSFKYFVQYEMKLPQAGNSGAKRGTICHSVFEFLFPEKRREYYKKIIAEKTYKAVPSVERYIDICCKKEKLTEDDKFLIDDMILVGLEYDFFCEKYPNAQNLAPELHFEIKNKKPRYTIKGFIDRPLIYEEDGVKKVRARDFKSSKKKYTADYLSGCNQGFMYSLALSKLYPGYDPSVEFIFLRFPKKPSQVFESTKGQRKGFEHYLEELSEFLRDFGYDKAISNMAATVEKNRWLCGVNIPGKFCCDFRNPKTYYYVEIDGKKKMALTKEELEGLGKVKEFKYKGCPYYYKGKYKHKQEKIF